MTSARTSSLLQSSASYVLLINRRVVSKCRAIRILFGFDDPEFAKRPIAIELNGESVARLLTGFKLVLEQLKESRKDFYLGS